MRVSLLGGTYQARSIIANAQRCVNLFPENNPSDAPVPVTHYPTPGKVVVGVAPNNAPIRGLYRPSNQAFLAVAAGNKLYSTSGQTNPPNLMTFTELGTLATNSGPVSMVDNGEDMMIVDGSASGYLVNLATRTFSNITDAAFLGANRVDYCDTFFVLSQPNEPTFYYSLSNSTSFDGQDVAQKTGFPDPIQGVAVVHSEVWLIGALTSEVWYLSGAADFAFQRVPGALIEQGTPSAASIARISQNGVGAVFFVSQNREGEAMIMMGQGYAAERISTYAIEYDMATYQTTTDAIGFCYQQAGHVFYQVTFPSANKTWVYDMSTGLWHQRASMDNNGLLNRDIASCAQAFGDVFVGDYRNGNLYALRQDSFTEDGNPIPRIRAFPHLLNDGNRAIYNRFIADVQCGSADSSITDLSLSLRCSQDRGASWGNPVTRSFGNTGQTLLSPQWRPLGLARDMVFELSWSAPVMTALNGAWVELTPSAT